LARKLEYTLPILFVAVVGHLLVLRTWWFHDDWVFLADAAGIAARGDSLVRVASYQWYWSLFYPLFGLQAWAWGLTRLALHAGSALLVARIAARGGMDRHGQIFAGLVFAAAPAAMESLYWGTGAVELLGVFFALAAVERWLAGTTTARWVALFLGALAVLSKESGLLLLVFFGASLAAEGRLRSWQTVGVGALAALAAWAAWLVARDFGTTADYAVDLGHAPRNFLVDGLWLVTPVPLLRDSLLLAPLAAVAGAFVWGMWGLTAWRARLRWQSFPLFCLGLALLAVAPATIVGDHAVPRYLYGPFAALALSLAALAYPQTGPRRATLVVVTILCAVVAWSGAVAMREARLPGGRPLHRLVFREYIARYSWQEIQRARIGPEDRVVIVRSADTDAGQFELLRSTLMDDLALRLLCGRRVQVAWREEILPEDAGAVVFTTAGANLVARSRTPGRE
jgi:hypothetical protein